MNHSISWEKVAAAASPQNPSSGGEAVVSYRECLKNHAAALGTVATDGCGEFMPGGSPEPLKCSACFCHRNFHRKVVQKSPRHLKIHPVAYGGAVDGGEHYGEGRGMQEGKKRLRTKFTREQNEKMAGFADRVGWRIQREDEWVAEQICQEIGINRRVLAVWMNNHRNVGSKKKLDQIF